MIYLNQSQILKLDSYISDLENKLENLNKDNYLSKTGGLITGLLNCDALILKNSGIKISGNLFNFNIYENNNNIAIGEISENLPTGLYVKLYSIYDNAEEDNNNADLFLESQSGIASLNLGDSAKIIFNNDINIYSKTNFSIFNGTGSGQSSLISTTGYTQLNRDLKIGNMYFIDISGILNAGIGNELIVDEFSFDNFYCKKYAISIYTRDSVKFRNISISKNQTGIILQQEESPLFAGAPYFRVDLYNNFVYLVIVNTVNKKVILKGTSSEFYK